MTDWISVNFLSKSHQVNYLLLTIKESSLKAYQARFARVVDYIEENLDRSVNVEELCKLVHLSKFHFHRQCSTAFGLPIMAVVKLLKLKRAAFQLAYRNEKKIVDIALASGYESHEAFSRAFKKHFLATPSAFRKTPDWSTWQLNYQPILEMRAKLMDNKTEYSVEITHFPQTLIAVLEHRGSPASLGQSISKFIAWRKMHNLPPNKSRTFNLIYDDPSNTPAEQFRFDLACAVKTKVIDDNYGIVTKVIPQGKCAKISYIGSDDTIGVAVDYLYSHWLANSDYELRDFPLFFQRVSFFPEVAEHQMITDIYLPIE